MLGATPQRSTSSECHPDKRVQVRADEALGALLIEAEHEEISGALALQDSCRELAAVIGRNR